MPTESRNWNELDDSDSESNPISPVPPTTPDAPSSISLPTPRLNQEDAVAEDAVAEDAVAEDAVAEDAVAEDAVAEDTTTEVAFEGTNKEEPMTYDEFVRKMNLVETFSPDASVLAELSTYNRESVDTFTDAVDQEVERQIQLNQLLTASATHVKEQIEYMRRFTEENGPIVVDQLSRLKEVGSRLQEVVSENHMLEHSNKEIMSLHDDSKLTTVANDMRAIQTEKKRILEYLNSVGIVLPDFI